MDPKFLQKQINLLKRDDFLMRRFQTLFSFLGSDPPKVFIINYYTFNIHYLFQNHGLKYFVLPKFVGPVVFSNFCAILF